MSDYETCATPTTLSPHYTVPGKTSDEWSTPPEVFSFARDHFGFFGFDLDAAAQSSNTKSVLYWTMADDALSFDWALRAWTQWQLDSPAIWLNPPYSLVGPFLDKAIEASRSGARVVALVKAATETKWFMKAVEEADQLVFLSPRVPFVPPPDREQKKSGSGGFGSALFYFSGRRFRLSECSISWARWR